MHQGMYGTNNRTRTGTLSGPGAQAVTTCTQTYNIYMIDAQLTAELLLLVMTTKCHQQLLLPLASIRKDLPYLPTATEM